MNTTTALLQAILLALQDIRHILLPAVKRGRPAHTLALAGIGQLNDREVAEREGVCTSTIRNRRVTKGISPSFAHSIALLKVRPEQLDWSIRDAVLARHHGVSRERIRQLRAAAGQPSSRILQREATAANAPVLDPNQTATENARRLHIASASVYRLAARQRLKLKPTTWSKVSWEGVDWTQSSLVLANQLGRSHAAVCRARLRYAPETRRKSGRPRKTK